MKQTFHIAVPTAFDSDESLNIERTIAHIKQLHQQGVTSVLVSGSTGEQHSLTLQEKLQLVKRLATESELLNQMEIIFGVAAIRQKEVAQLAENINKTQLAGIMLGFPPYVVPTQEEALTYAKTIIQLSQKPTIIYNNPGRTGFDLSIKNILQLSQYEQVVGIKEAGAKEKVSILKNKINRDDFYYYAGGEIDLADKVAHGFNRLSSIAGNIAPLEISQWFAQLVNRTNINDYEQEKITTILNKVYDGSPIVNLKRELQQLGVCRSPLGNES